MHARSHILVTHTHFYLHCGRAIGSGGAVAGAVIVAVADAVEQEQAS